MKMNDLPPVPVEEGVRIIDCTQTCNKFGLHYHTVYLWCVKDVCGIICAVFTWLLVAYAEFTVMCVILLPGPSQMYSFCNALLFNWFVIMALTAHVRTMLSDPVRKFSFLFFIFILFYFIFFFLIQFLEFYMCTCLLEGKKIYIIYLSIYIFFFSFCVCDLTCKLTPTFFFY